MVNVTGSRFLSLRRDRVWRGMRSVRAATKCQEDLHTLKTSPTLPKVISLLVFIANERIAIFVFREGKMFSLIGSKERRVVERKDVGLNRAEISLRLANVSKQLLRSLVTFS